MSQSGQNTAPVFNATNQMQSPPFDPQSSYPAMSQMNPKPDSSGGGRLKFALFMTFAFLIVFVVGITVGGIQWWLLLRYQQPTVAEKQPDKPNVSPQKDAKTNEDASALTQKINSSTPDQRQPVAEALALAEITDPNDYRFPFEHAKLSVTGNEHHHAFGLLFIAAERAIDSGKADELLSQVQKEKDGAFYRCSRGHDEWKMLVTALQSKDKSPLVAAMTNMHRDLIGGTDDMKMEY